MRPLCPFLFALALVVSAVAENTDTPVVRERLSFNDGWRFHRGEAPDEGGSLHYKQVRPWLLATGKELINAGVAKPVRPDGNPGQGVSFVQPDFDDTGWRSLDLPHDWAIEGPFSPDLPGETGKLPWQGTGWYRKTFTLPATDADKHIALDVDGAMAYSTFWLNGQFVGGWPYGYTSFRLDLTPFAKPGARNVLVVRLNNPPDSSRWYPGSGLYRNVWLVKTPPIRIRHWGVFVSTPRITDEAAVVNIDVVVENLTEAKAAITAAVRIHEVDAHGALQPEPVAYATATTMEIDPSRGERQAMRSLAASVTHPRLWSHETPHRYAAVTSVEVDGRLIDREITLFGIRSLRLDPDRGLILNGRQVPLQGVCMHHDLGALGSAIHVRAIERQVRILKEMGCNAIRTSHNPPAPELLEVCDRLGMLVMDEAFDMWRRSKKPADPGAADPFDRAHDYARIFDDWHERDLRALIRRDRNHPSVVFWSTGNEVIEQWFSDGWQLSARLSGIVREEDRTRPLTSGYNGEIAGYSGFQTTVDAVGYNYNPEEYIPFRKANPAVMVYSSESASTLSSRGEYFFPVTPDDKLKGRENFHVSSYDFSAPEWASSPDVEFRGLDQAPFTGGEFVWTGFDYLGEPTPYNADTTNLLNFSDPEQKARMAAELERLGRIRVPSRSSYFGIIDLAGFPKDRFYLYQSRWIPGKPMAHIAPHWNWPGRVGQVTPVQVYTSGDEAELFLNGRSLGRKKKGQFEYRLYWGDVIYEPGELKVVAYKDGEPWSESSRRTTGPASILHLSADRTELRADGSDLAFITVTIADAGGLLVPRSQHRVHFSVEGPAEIIAVDNGDPTSFEPFQATQRSAFNGLVLGVLRTKRGQTGSITLHARSDGLQAATLHFQSGN